MMAKKPSARILPSLLVPEAEEDGGRAITLREALEVLLEEPDDPADIAARLVERAL
jgi:hypothetical protein